MATNIADHVRVGTTGAVWVAPSGTTLPTNATSALNSAFREMGYISEEGVTLSLDIETTDIKAWQNGTTVRTVQTGSTTTLGFTPMETNSTVLNEFFPGGYSASTALVTSAQATTKCWVVQVEDAGNDVRLVIPAGQLTSRGTITFANGAAVTYPFTISAYPDGSDVHVYYYIASESS